MLKKSSLIVSSRVCAYASQFYCYQGRLKHLVDQVFIFQSYTTHYIYRLTEEQDSIFYSLSIQLSYSLVDILFFWTAKYVIEWHVHRASERASELPSVLSCCLVIRHRLRQYTWPLRRKRKAVYKKEGATGKRKVRKSTNYLQVLSQVASMVQL